MSISPEAAKWVERGENLDILQTKVRKLEAELKSIPDLDVTDKWEWPTKANTIVQQFRALAADPVNATAVRGKLDELLEWPSKDKADPKLFLGGKEGYENFNRNEDWFETMGFTKYQTPYTFSNRWDKQLIKATFLVPKDLDDSRNVPIMWFFHGGGFCTGAGDFIPWYSQTSLAFARQKNAIVIAPDYPLGPEGNYKDIADAIRDFLEWFKEDGCFESGYKSWTQWLLKTAKIEDAKLDKTSIFIEGESAGGHAAVTAMFLNAERHHGTKLPIQAVLLRYPMIKHYARSFPASGTVNYMGVYFSQSDVEQRANDIEAAVLELEEKGLVPTRSSNHPPHGMSAAFLLSMTKLWQGMFQREHLPDCSTRFNEDGSDFMDGLERAVYYADNVVEKCLPPVIMYHGHDDSNCPFADTETFRDLLLKNFPRAYGEGKKVYLERVNELKGKPEYKKETKRIECGPTTDVGHGFDYSLKMESEGFLKRAYGLIDGFWSPGL